MSKFFMHALITPARTCYEVPVHFGVILEITGVYVP